MLLIFQSNFPKVVPTYCGACQRRTAKIFWLHRIIKVGTVSNAQCIVQGLSFSQFQLTNRSLEFGKKRF